MKYFKVRRDSFTEAYRINKNNFEKQREHLHLV